MSIRILASSVAIAALMAGPALAADLGGGYKDPPADYAQSAGMVNWSGFYVGGAVGYGNANHDLKIYDYFKDYCSDDAASEGFKPFENSDRSKTLGNRKKAVAAANDGAGDTNQTLNPLYNPLDDQYGGDDANLPGGGPDGVSNTNEDIGVPVGQFVETAIDTTAWSKCADVMRGNNTNRGAGDRGAVTESRFLPGSPSDTANVRGSASTGGNLADVEGARQEVGSLDGINSSGFVGDVRVGYDLARGRYLFGVFGTYGFNAMEADGSAAGIGQFSLEKGDEWSVGARVGLLVAPRTLAYIMAAYTQTDYELSGISGSGLGAKAFSQDTTFQGATVGGGLEFALTANLFVGLEATHTFYGNETIFDKYDAASNVGTSIEDELSETKVMLTAKMKFNGLGE